MIFAAIFWIPGSVVRKDTIYQRINFYDSICVKIFFCKVEPNKRQPCCHGKHMNLSTLEG